MGKRKPMADPTSRKRPKLAREAEEPVSSDLWGAEAPVCGRPKNKEHSARKQEMIDKTSQARHMRSVPSDAQSYNPDKAAHQRAADEAAAVLLRKEREQAKIAARSRVDPAVRKNCVGDDLTPPSWSEELLGDPRPEDSKAKRKTKQQRNKSRQLGVEAKIRRAVKVRNKVVNDIDRIDSIRQEMASAAKESAEKQKKKKQLRLKKLLNPRIGRKRYKPSAEDLQTDDEIKPSLRAQGKVSAAMRDPLKVRYETFQARNIIPATAPLVRRPPRKPAKYYVVTRND